MLGSPLLPLTLAVGAAAADGGGAHRVAFYLVLLAIPTAAGAALAAAGELLQSGRGVMRMSCTAVALVLLVLSSASRANAPQGGTLPALAFSALIGGLIAYGSLGIVWLARPPRRAARLQAVSDRP
jgi:hypothetical protein